MKINLALVLAALLFVSACSDKAAVDTSEVQIQEEEVAVDNTTDPLNGVSLQGYDAQNITPGTQQDLVANIGDRVFFGYDRSDLDAESRATLERQAQWLQKHPNLSIVVEGHCDERGTREYNLALGDRRAAAVKNYLVALGVNPSRVSTISYGKERPAVLGSNPASWAQNRRGVTIVQ